MKNSNKLLKIKHLKTLPQIGSWDKMNGNNVTFLHSDGNSLFSIRLRKINWSGLQTELSHILSMRILIISWPCALFGSNFWIIFAMSSELKLLEEITFSVRLNKTEGSTLELLFGERWLAKKLLNNSTLSSYLVT